MRPTVLVTVDAARSAVRALARGGDAVVLVPTMGDLHDGHLRLVEVARRFGRVIVSVFVNPTQFAPGEDFERYPRRLEADVEALAPHGVDAVFAPSVEEMYPPGESTRVAVGGLTEPLCGAHREGHFLGVTTVCTKLFAALAPDVAVFGQKDAQQCLVLHRLVRDLRLPLDLVFVPTVRGADGLALSSRNRYLTVEQRDRALALSGALRAGRERLAAGERRRAEIERAMREAFGAADAVDYLEARSLPGLEADERLRARVLLAGAARFGAARLIDNLALDLDADTVREAPLVDECTPEAVLARRGR